jgi:DNA-binding MarR family transcriptional regulator
MRSILDERAASATTTADPSLTQASIEELDAELSLAVSRLFRRLRAQKRVDEEIGDSHRTVLALLVKEGPRTLGELSDHERVKPPSMNQTVNLLVESGYVERRDDPSDGRKVILAATSAGEAVIVETRRRLHEWLQAQLRELTPEERQVLAVATGIISKVASS